MGRILVVDDEVSVLASFGKMLSQQGHAVTTAGRADEALTQIEADAPDLVVMDINLPGMDGLAAFKRIQQTHPHLPVVIMTGYGTTEYAIEATKLGAFDYQLKPFDPAEMLAVIERGLESARLMRRRVELDAQTPPPAADAIVGRSPGMQEVYKLIGRAAPTEATVLIRGETGTGKELVARALYQHSRRSAGPLVVVNCAAIPEPLLESELFGHEKGAFTGAIARRLGKFEQAQNGTLFLDEIGDIPYGTQAKILRALQTCTFERVGGSETIHADVRVLAATHRDLEKAMHEGTFREDLYHRLDVVTIHLPALRTRADDIPLLVRFFLARAAQQLGTEVPPMGPAALELLQSHTWPGNVRELEHCIQRALILTRGHAIQEDDVRRALARRGADTAGSGPDDDSLRALVQAYLGTPPQGAAHELLMDRVDGLLVAEALRLTRGNQTRAARLLGLTRPTLQAKMQKHGIRRETDIREA